MTVLETPANRRQVVRCLAALTDLAVHPEDEARATAASRAGCSG